MPGAELRPIAQEIGRLLAGGHLVQVRQKRWSARRLLGLLDEVQRRSPAGALGRLLVNGRCDVALCIERVGVHLPEDGLPVRQARRILGDARLLGVSCHEDARLQEAAAAGADLATLGPIFGTPGKGPPLGLSGLKRLSWPKGLPVFGLGGIDLGAIEALAATELHGIACIRAVFEAAVAADAAEAIGRRWLEQRAKAGRAARGLAPRTGC